ncbi:MAG: alpha/beta hydrolase, partial [Anaerolineales bacterium]|nr:alpha/beta hydrolase [Anaerolineales bacterium]
QLRKSWYMFFFQLPAVPEVTIQAADWRLGLEALRGSSRPGTFSADDLAAYQCAWSRPGAFTGMLNWYRAIMQHSPHPSRPVQVSVPTFIIWGAQDMFLGQEMVEPSAKMCVNGRFAIIDEASHWVQHEEPEQVNQLLAEFFAGDESPA